MCGGRAEWRTFLLPGCRDLPVRDVDSINHSAIWPLVMCRFAASGTLSFELCIHIKRYQREDWRRCIRITRSSVRRKTATSRAAKLRFRRLRHITSDRFPSQSSKAPAKSRSRHLALPETASALDDIADSAGVTRRCLLKLWPGSACRTSGSAARASESPWFPWRNQSKPRDAPNFTLY